MNDKGNIKAILISALVTGIITVLATLVINYFSSKENKLSYLSQTSIPFQKDSLNVRIYNIDVVNNGDEMIEGIKGFIQFNYQNISDYKVKSSPVLPIKDSVSGSQYSISIGSLNPSEKVTISFLISSPNQIDSLPKVDFRAKGLSAQKEEATVNKEETPLYESLLAGMSLAVAASTILLSLARKNLRKSSEDEVNDDEQHSDDQNKILAYLCGVHGLMNESEKYLQKRNKVSYWSEADYFGNLALVNREDTINEKRLFILLDLVKYANVSKESVGIVYYNIAKIYKALGKSEKCEEYLNKAKGIIPKRIHNRLLIDNFF